jgi:hypothetical protein
MIQFHDPDQVDADPSFTTLFDDDFKVGAGGVTKKTFTFVYGTWINLCNNKRQTVKLVVLFSLFQNKIFDFFNSLYPQHKKMI